MKDNIYTKQEQEIINLQNAQVALDKKKQEEEKERYEELKKTQNFHWYHLNIDISYKIGWLRFDDKGKPIIGLEGFYALFPKKELGQDNKVITYQPKLLNENFSTSINIMQPKLSMNIINRTIQSLISELTKFNYDEEKPYSFKDRKESKGKVIIKDEIQHINVFKSMLKGFSYHGEMTIEEFNYLTPEGTIALSSDK